MDHSEEKKDKLEQYEEIEREQDMSEDIENKSDADLKKDPQKEFSMGVETDEYDIMPPMGENTEAEAEIEGKEGIEIEYSFNGEEVREGLKVYQRETLFKKNMVYSLILLVVFGVYMVNIVRNPGEILPMFLAVLCVTVVCFLWYLPAKHVKKTAEAADMADLKFKMTIYDTGVRIAEENGSFVIAYGKEINKILETENLFLICVGKERMFILPKKYLNERVKEVKGIFQNALSENYKVKIQTK